jgi:hypothetical protein
MVIVIGFLSLILLIFANNQHMSQIFTFFNSYSFKEVLAGTEEEEEEENDEDSLEQKICNKLFESEECENVKELTEEEIKAESIISRYLEPVKSKEKLIDNGMNNETKIDSTNRNISSNGSSTILSNEVESKDSTNSNQQINNELLSTQLELLSTQLNQSSLNQSVLNNTQNLTQNLNNLTQE